MAGAAAGASLTGMVVENRSGRALARVKLVLQARGAASRAGVLTQWSGSGGQFVFSGLPAGIYFLEASKKGFAKLNYGQRRFGEPGTPILLEANSHFAAELRLKRLGVVTGEVTDENQVGLPDIPVYAYQAGERLKAVQVARTDDRGVYRLAGLTPGRYKIRTAAKQLEGGVSLLPTYYGQATAAGAAREVEVRLDEEVTGVNIAPRPGKLAALGGRLLGAGAREVILVTDTGPRRARVEPGGRFRFGQLAPGRYTLLVDPAAAGGKLAAYGEAYVAEGPAEVALEMKAAPRLTVWCELADGGGAAPKGVSIFLRRKEFGDTAPRLRCGQSTIWSPGDWQVGVATPPQYYVAGILEAERGEHARQFRLLPGESRQITVLLGTRPAVIEGTVLAADGTPAVGAPVFLNASAAELRGRVGGVRQARTDGEGRYRFDGLPPGEYELLSSYQLQQATEENWPAGLGTVVNLEEGTEATVDLSLRVLE